MAEASPKTYLSSSNNNTIKFLCSYGGKILPRYPDGKLRYHGGQTRLLSVDRSLSFSELVVKLGEVCGNSVCLRCQLPTEDLDSLVSITCDEDLVNLIEEYERVLLHSKSLKIKAFLSRHSTKSGSQSSSGSSTATHEALSPGIRFPVAAINRCKFTPKQPVVGYYNRSSSSSSSSSAGGNSYRFYGNGGSRSYLVHNGNNNFGMMERKTKRVIIK